MPSSHAEQVIATAKEFAPQSIEIDWEGEVNASLFLLEENGISGLVDQVMQSPPAAAPALGIDCSSLSKDLRLQLLPFAGVIASQWHRLASDPRRDTVDPFFVNGGHWIESHIQLSAYLQILKIIDSESVPGFSETLRRDAFANYYAGSLDGHMPEQSDILEHWQSLSLQGYIKGIDSLAERHPNAQITEEVIGDIAHVTQISPAVIDQLSNGNKTLQMLSEYAANIDTVMSGNVMTEHARASLAAALLREGVAAVANISLSAHSRPSDPSRSREMRLLENLRGAYIESPLRESCDVDARRAQIEKLFHSFFPRQS